MKLNQRGFTLIEGLLVIIALTLISGVGYYVYDKQSDGGNQESKPTVTAFKDAPTQSPEEKTSIPEGWIEYKGNDLGFSFAYPSEWGTANVENLAYPHAGLGYRVAFSKIGVLGMLASNDYAYQGPARDGLTGAIYGPTTYAMLSQEIVDNAEKSKVNDSYNVLLVDQGNNFVISMNNNCLSAGHETNLLAKIQAKQELIMNLTHSKEVLDCTPKLSQTDIDQSLVAILKQIPATIHKL
jgi:hypothetical protein